MNCFQWAALAVAAIISFHLFLDSRDKEIDSGNSPRRRGYELAALAVLVIGVACMLGSAWALFRGRLW